MTQVMTVMDEVEKALAFSQDQNFGWRLIRMGPDPAEPCMFDGFIYLDRDLDKTTKVPPEADWHLDQFKMRLIHSNIKRVLIGNKPEFAPITPLETEEEVVDPEDNEVEEFMEKINGIGVAVVSGIFLFAIFAVLVSLVVGLAILILPALLMMGMAAVLVGGFLAMSALGFDPYLVAIVEIEEGQLYAWVLVYSWIDDEHATGI